MSAGTAMPAASRNVGAKSTFSAIARLLVPRLMACRPADQERHAQRFLVHEALVEHAVVAEEESLVARVDHDGVLREALPIEEVEQAPDVVVHRLDGRQVVLHVALILPAGERLAGQRYALAVANDRHRVRFGSEPACQLGAGESRRRLQLEIAPRQVGRDALLVLVQRIGARGVRVPERRRLGNPARRELRRVGARQAATAGAAPCDAPSGRTAGCAAASP